MYYDAQRAVVRRTVMYGWRQESELMIVIVWVDIVDSAVSLLGGHGPQILYLQLLSLATAMQA